MARADDKFGVRRLLVLIAGCASAAGAQSPPPPPAAAAIAQQIPIAVEAKPLFATAKPSGVEGVDRYRPGNIIVTFEGGISGLAIGDVLNAAAVLDGLRTRPYVIQPGDSPCAIIARDYPPPCEGVLKVLNRLNPALTGKQGFQIGDTLNLPDVHFRRFRKARPYAEVMASEQAKSRSILKNWGAKVLRKSSRATVVDYEAYDLIFQTETPTAQLALLTAIQPLASPNVTIDAVRWSKQEASVYGSLDPAEQQAACRDGTPGMKVDYLSYATTDADLLAIVSSPPPDATVPTVYIIDVKLEPTPNLAGAIDGYTPPPGLPEWRCAWAGEAKPTNHATHLAGIIASRDNGYGFVGLAPTAQIVPYPWLEQSQDEPGRLAISSGNALRLADEINNNVFLTGPKLYLLAGDLERYPEGAINALGQIKTPQGRFQLRPVERTIDSQRPLFVVAAGQQKGASQGVALSDLVPRSPQNLGDLRNVIVVSACDDCTRASPTLMANANFSSANSDGRFVQIAAPGGKPMLGWLGAGGIGVDYGTSQAAAFAAGVVARMIGYWPRIYSTAELVKTRIQVTSWPIFPRVGAATDDSAKIATGVVDPTLAWLDPTKHWLKTTTEGWRQVKLKPFVAKSLVFTDASGEDVSVTTRAIARFVRVTDAGSSPQWVIYRDLFRENSQKYLPGWVARTDPLTVPRDATLALCDGGAIPLSAVVDLVVAVSGIQPGCR